MTKKRILSLVCLLLLVVLGGEVILSAFSVPAEAVTASYSDVLDDLQKDEKFNPADYPVVSSNLGLDVIAVSEGEHGELYVYVYTPSDTSKDFRAKKISISNTSPSDKNLSFQIYDLIWLNTNGVFSKYKVNGFDVSYSQCRYYSISSIYRNYYEGLDACAELVSEKNYVASPVGKCWCVYFSAGQIIYEMEHMQYVDIDIIAADKITYYEGFKLYTSKCDSHFVAFSATNFDVEKIYDADISYSVTEYVKSIDLQTGQEHTTVRNSYTVENQTLKDTDIGFNEGDGLFGKKYVWNRILTIDAFKKQIEDFTNESIEADISEKLSSAQFVFQFLETDYSVSTALGTSTAIYSRVSDFGVLRLHFLSKGKTYNLGVVSDLVGTGSGSMFEVDQLDNFENQEWYQKIIALICLVLFICLISPCTSFCVGFFRIFLIGIKTILKFLLNVVSLPFRIIKKNKTG